MRYSESPAKSAEILRLVLPQIAGHGGQYNPMAYRIWYEHVAGLNPELTLALESHLKQREVLTAADIELLCDLHLNKRDQVRTEELQDCLGELINKLSALLEASGDGAAEYSRALAECQQGLDGVTDAAGLQRIIRSLVSSTDNARATSERMRADLVANQQEMLKMRAQVGTLQSEVIKDPLTRLRNRRGFQQAVAQLYNGKSDRVSGAAVLVVDIDHFKNVNDKYGHLFGDQVIRACAQVLSSKVKGRDVVARFGGEEFVVLLPDTASQGAMTVAEQIRVAFGHARVRRAGKDEVVDKVTISVGVAVCGAEELLEQVINRADAALYQAKKDGRNCVRFANEADVAEIRGERLAMGGGVA